MVDINDYKEEKSCVYKNEEYLVRDNGAVLRKTPKEKKPRPLDNKWTWGTPDKNTKYFNIGGERVNRIVATAFHGEPPSKEYIADHVDTNRQNNRPENLRWVTKLENILLNPITRKKIEYVIQDTIDAFLENPAAYRELLSNGEFSWMRTVTPEEAQATRDNLTRWAKSKSSMNQSSKRINERVYTSSYGFQDDFPTHPLSKQIDWKSPTYFLCCPNEITQNPMQTYFENLSNEKDFAKNRYGKMVVEDFAIVEETNIILVITIMLSSIKDFGLLKIYFEDGFYVHENLDTFFTREGAEKQFALARGLEWTGGDAFDDYC